MDAGQAKARQRAGLRAVPVHDVEGDAAADDAAQGAMGAKVRQSGRALHGNGVHGRQGERFQFAHESLFSPQRRIYSLDMVAALLQAAAEIEKMAA